MAAKDKVSYQGKTVYIGLDVHKKNYSIVCICDQIIVKKATVKAHPETVVNSFKKWFQGAVIKTAYEAGFSGFYLHRTFEKAGIKSIVVNAASIKVAANDKVKTDPRDAKKIAEQLSDKRLVAIYVPTEEEEIARLLPRTRQQIIDHRADISRQIKSRLEQFGLIDGEDTAKVTPLYIKNIESSLPKSLLLSFTPLFQIWISINDTLTEINKELREQAKEDKQNELIYRSAPGIGAITSRILATELGDMSRFHNIKGLFCYLGLTPCEFSSGDKVRRGHISRQGSGLIRKMLIESAWVAIKKDPALRMFFDQLAVRAGKKKAIVAVARKLIGRVRACMRSHQNYALGVVS